MEPVVKVACRYEIIGDGLAGTRPDGAITFHVQRSPSAPEFDEADRTAIASRVYQWWVDAEPHPDVPYPPGRSMFPGFMLLRDISVWNVSPGASDVTFLELADEDQPGDAAGTMMAPQLAFVVGLRTLVDTRRGRGRIYFPATNALEVERTGLVANEYRIRLGRTCAVLAARIRGDDFGVDPKVLSVFSRASGEANAVTHFVIPNRVATQRRRALRTDDYMPISLTGDS